MAKLLREKYKTYEGAAKRAGFENGVAPGEFRRGETARLYRFRVVKDGDIWRVERYDAKADAPLDLLRHHVTGAIERGEGQAIIGKPEHRGK